MRMELELIKNDVEKKK